MLILSSSSKAEITVKASRFIAQAHQLTDKDEVKGLVNGLREDHPGASHVVWAFTFGERGDIFGYSDDREPRGTAGRPVFEVLRGSGVMNCLVTVVRYFGGTKLGTGGLARAYSDAAKKVMDTASVHEFIESSELACTVDYSVYERVKQLFDEHGGSISDEDFGEQVEIRGSVPSARMKDMKTKVLDYTAGKAVFR